MSTTRAGWVAIVSGVVVAAAGGMSAISAYADPSSISVSMFSGPASSAHWSTVTSNDSDPFSVQLSVGPWDPDHIPYAGISLQHVSTIPPSNPPSFDFNVDAAQGDQGGSPRLVITFSDGGNMALNPVNAPSVANWHSIGGTGSNWDNNGGSCGFLYQAAYSDALACHSSAVVTGAFIVSDSAWFPSSLPGVGAYHTWIDNITYDGTIISQPSDNRNS